jgi:hypothetical protein
MGVSVGDVTHPGPEPALFEFPFAAARQALAATEAAIEQLLAMVRRHETTYAAAVVDFEGRTREQFEAALELTLAQVGEHVRALQQQADDLSADLAAAERKQATSEADRRRWRADLERWRSAERQDVTG